MSLTQRNIAIALSALLVCAIIYYFRSIVTYVLVAWVVSTIGQPLMRLFERVRWGKIFIPSPLAAAMTLALFAAFLGVIFSFFLPMVVEQANNLATVDFKTIATALEKPLSDLTAKGHRFGFIPQKETAVSLIEKELASWLKPTAPNQVVSSFLSTASSLIVGIFAVLFISFFFLREKTMFLEFLVSVLPRQYESNVREAVNDVVFLLSRYFGGILLQMAFVATFLSIGLFFIGVKNAILVAVFAALIYIVPYFGPLMGCLFAFSVAISSNLNLDFYTQIVPILWKVFFLFGILQILNEWFVAPTIFSKRILAHPLEIFIVTLVGAKIGGISGMLLAIPAYTVGRVVAREFFNQFRFVQSITKGLENSGVV